MMRPSEYLRRERDSIERDALSIFDTDKLAALRPHALWQLNVLIAQACYAERVVAQRGDWYANISTKLPFAWQFEGGH